MVALLQVCGDESEEQDGGSYTVFVHGRPPIQNTFYLPFRVAAVAPIFPEIFRRACRVCIYFFITAFHDVPWTNSALRSGTRTRRKTQDSFQQLRPRQPLCPSPLAIRKEGRRIEALTPSPSSVKPKHATKAHKSNP